MSHPATRSVFILLFLSALGGLSAEESAKSIVYYRFSPFHCAADTNLESQIEENMKTSLAEAGLTPVARSERGASLSEQDPSIKFVLTGYYRKQENRLILYSQIYDPASGLVIDAISIGDEERSAPGLKLPEDELRVDSIQAIRLLMRKTILRLVSNPQRRERRENINENLLSTPLGQEIRFPVSGEDVTAQTEEVFKMLENQQVVTSSSRPTTIRESPSAIYVITSTQIHERGYRTLVDALQDIPGFDIIHVYGVFPDLIHQRGLVGNNQRTLLYINGVPDNNITENAILGGSSRFPLNNVRRIEVVSGPASALYGANAFNGVINIITEDGSENTGNIIEGSAGAYNSGLRNPGASATITFRGHGEEMEDFTYGVSAYFYRTAGPNFGGIGRLDKPSVDPNDAVYNTSTKLCGGICVPDSKSVGYYWTPFYTNSREDTYNITASFRKGNFRFQTVNWQYLQGDGTFANATQQIDTNQFGFKGSSWDFRNNSAMAGYLFPISSKLSLDSEGTIRHTEVLSSGHEQAPNVYGPYSVYAPYDVTSTNGYSRPDYSTDIKEKLHWQASSNLTTTVGIEGTHQVVPRGYGSDLRVRYSNFAGFIEQTWRPIQSISLVAGYRYDNNSIYGSASTPRLSAVWTISPNLTVKAMAGTGFRAPTAFELYGATNQRLNNLQLTSEKLRSYELGVSGRFLKRFYFSSSAYYNVISDLILEVETNQPNPNNVGTNWNQFQNVGHARIYGLESQGDFQISDFLSVFLNYTVNHGVYEDLPLKLTSSPSTKGRVGDEYALDLFSSVSGRNYVPSHGPIPGIAPNRVNAGLTFRFFHYLTAHVGFNYADIRRNIATDPVRTTKGYLVSSLNIRWQKENGFFCQLLVRNLSNEQFFDPGIRTATGAYYPTQQPLELRNIWLSAGYKF